MRVFYHKNLGNCQPKPGDLRHTVAVYITMLDGRTSVMDMIGLQGNILPIASNLHGPLNNIVYLVHCPHLHNIFYRQNKTKADSMPRVVKHKISQIACGLIFHMHPDRVLAPLPMKQNIFMSIPNSGGSQPLPPKIKTCTH